MKSLNNNTLLNLKILIKLTIYAPYFYFFNTLSNLIKKFGHSSFYIAKSCLIRSRNKKYTSNSKAHANNKNNSKSYGFTLIELLIVFVILGISVGIGAYRWQQFQLSYELTSNMQRMLLFLSNIQTQANWDNNTYSILLLNNQDSSCLIATTNPNSTDKNCQPNDYSNIKAIFELSDQGVKFKSISPSELAFYGVRNTAKAGHIILENELGSLRLILSVRGRLRVCSESKEITSFPSC